MNPGDEVHSETPLLMTGRPIRGPGTSGASIPVPAQISEKPRPVQ